MKNYLFKLGIKAKKISLNNISSIKKNKVLTDYIDLILKNQVRIISENQKDFKNAEKKKIKTKSFK